MATPDYLFEASWEVCNKVGGIYTVVKTKVQAVQKNCKNYFLIGPYFEGNAVDLFEEKSPPSEFVSAFDEMKEIGVDVHYGTWLVDGEPNVLLLEFSGLKIPTNDIKKWLWENYQIDSLNSGFDFDEPMRWSWAVGLMLEKMASRLKGRILHHGHEWLSAFSVLYLKKAFPVIGTVFTTHATMLGRSLAGSGVPLYDVLDKIDPDEEARKCGIQAKYTTEKACAHNADVFTTVSETTALEAELILGKKVDVVLPNGLDLSYFPTIEETTLLHVQGRNRIREFLAYFFFPYYAFDLDHNLMYFVVGRFEYKNKGLDLIVSALKMLNEDLKARNSDRTITFFFWIPMGNKGINSDVAENKHYYDHIKDLLNRNSDDIMTKLLHDLISQSCSMEESIFTSDYVKKLKMDIKNFKREGNPPISTHDLIDGNNELIKALKESGLDNKEDDRVKVIVYPVYLNGNDNLLNLAYYDAMAGTHLGVFPSYYEPWGYTPVESMSMGVPAVTSDLAGFGRYMKPNLLKKNPGVFVLDRFHKEYGEQAENLYKLMRDFAEYDHAERVQNKINAKNMSMLTDWEHFIKKYLEAYNKALKKEIVQS